MDRKPLIIIAGPTATGKSALAVKLARKIGGEIISADSMQVYRRMDIGTAKVTEREKEGVPHYLIDILEPDQPFSVADFKAKAKEAVETVYSHGNIPILCGGTGFYIQSVLYDINFGDDEADAGLKQKLEQEMELDGPGAMHERLRQVDPDSAAAIHQNNRKRVIRALEYYYLTGNRISEHNAAEHARKSPYDYRYFVLSMQRDILYARIDRRVDRMIESGLVEEVKKLRDSGCTADMVSMQGLGYKEIFAYLEGRSTLEEAVEKIKQETRHFSKRQITWFKREPEAVRIPIDEYGFDQEKILDRVAEDCTKLKKI
jgi:tRNA dimethylallyltransferase